MPEKAQTPPVTKDNTFQKPKRRGRPRKNVKKTEQRMKAVLIKCEQPKKSFNQTKQDGGGNSEAGEVGAGVNGAGEDGTADVGAEDIGTEDAEIINAELMDAEPGQTNNLSGSLTAWTSNAKTNSERASRAAHDNTDK